MRQNSVYKVKRRSGQSAVGVQEVGKIQAECREMHRGREIRLQVVNRFPVFFHAIFKMNFFPGNDFFRFRNERNPVAVESFFSR